MRAHGRASRSFDEGNMEPPFYTPSFTKHLNSLARSGYFGSYLDADDRRFLEYVKRTGLANGSVPSSNTVLLEELEFWRGPYTIQPNVDRHFGRRPIPQETPEQRAARQARSSRWHAQRIIRENEKAIAAAELAREQREHEAAQAKRKAREKMTDAEWEAAAPPFGGMKGRHYVPEWKMDAKEIDEGRSRRFARQNKELLKQAALSMKKNAERLKSEDAERRARWRREEIEREKQESDRVHAALAQEAAATRQKEQAEQDARLRVIEEARENVRRIDRELLGYSVATTGANYSEAEMKSAILTLLNSTPGKAWTADEMARAVGGCTREYLDQCIDSLVRDGQLRKMDKAP